MSAPQRPAPRPFAELITIGLIAKPQGHRGEVAVEPYSDREDRFPNLRRAYVAGPGGIAREVVVSGCRPHMTRFVLKLDGVDSMDAAATLRGLELRIGAEELEALPEGSYYHHQLVGLQVFERDRPLGRVEKLLETGAGAPVLVVRGPQGETLLPLAAEFVENIDLAQGRMQVALHEPSTRAGN
jgi:16S rRNA processing protein RimM